MAAISDFFVGLYSTLGPVALIVSILGYGFWLVYGIASIVEMVNYDPQCGD